MSHTSDFGDEPTPHKIGPIIYHQHRYTVVVEWGEEPAVWIGLRHTKALKVMCEGCGEIKETKL